MKINIFQSEIGFYRSATRQIRKETISCQDVPSHDIKRTLIRSKRNC